MIKNFFKSKSVNDYILIISITLLFYLISYTYGIFLNFASLVVVHDTHGLEELLSIPVGLSVSLMILTYRRNKELKRLNSELHNLVIADDLTGLWNRRGFNLHGERQIEIARQAASSSYVMFLDLDRFKMINDTLGHRYGDLLLQLVAERLHAFSHSGAVVARLGGDEFIIFFPENDTEDQEAFEKAEKIIELLSRPFNLNGQEIYITSSIGISSYPSDGDNLEDLVKYADIAMYRAKAKGKNNYQFYTSSMIVQTNRHFILENSLYKALERKEFIIYYQPQVNTKSREIEGVEALLRWNHPELGVVSPTEFIPMAEETGLIMSIGEWVLRAACEQNKRWQEQGVGKFRMSVNLSARQFQNKNLVNLVKKVLEDTRLEAQYLNIEITESMLIQETDDVIRKLNELKSMGVFISIDDFGTGYSSLAYLYQLPIDVLKIDRSFISGIGIDANAIPISRAIITLAHSLNISAIAEGVETVAQLDCLTKYNCNQIQGYLFSRPLPPEELLENLKKGYY